jgi:hypothetical protein
MQSNIPQLKLTRLLIPGENAETTDKHKANAAVENFMVDRF